jgi:serine/threonine-protein kinase
MLIGEPPFTGASAQAVLRKMLTAEPVPPSELRKSVPEHVEAAVLKAIEKLPADRFVTGAEFGEQLLGPATDSHPRRRSMPARRVVMGNVALASVLVALSTAGLVFWSNAQAAAPSSQPIRASIPLPDSLRLSGPFVALSRNGDRVFVPGERAGARQLYQRLLDGWEFTPIPGTDEAIRPVPSPDGRWLAFSTFLGRGLARMPTEGGPMTVLDPDAQRGDEHYGHDQAVYYSPRYNGGLWRIAPEGVPERITEPELKRLVPR